MVGLGGHHTDGDQNGEAGDKQNPRILLDDFHDERSLCDLLVFLRPSSLPDAMRNFVASSAGRTVTNPANLSIDLYQ